MIDTLIAFDLDDTLYKEGDYVRSARHEIARRISDSFGQQYPALADPAKLVGIMEPHRLHGPGAFDALAAALPPEVEQAIGSVYGMVRVYRSHTPSIALSHETEATLRQLRADGATLAVITDGRIETQSIKVRALGLFDHIHPSLISISEAVGSDKHSPLPFLRIMAMAPAARRYVYVGDNLTKDFIWPNRLGWTTVCLADTARKNLMPQVLAPNTSVIPEGMPQKVITSLAQLPDLIAAL